MGSLRQVGTGVTSVLEPEHLVGRSPICALQLAETYVSAQHASIRWTGKDWELKDLGSKNGTFLEGAPLRSGEPYPLKQGAIVCFGEPEQKWTLLSDEPPKTMAVAMDGTEPAVMEGEILAIPSADDPQATVFRGADGLWKLERADVVVRTLDNRAIFEVAGRRWRFCCSSLVSRTATSAVNRQLRQVRLQFFVSRDEEHVRVEVETVTGVIDVGSRSHNYLLLTLARQRLKDAEAGLPDTSCGWVYQDELLKALAISPTQLNIDIFRIRKHFASLDLLSAADIIERRPRTKQLRIGVASLVIQIL